MQYHKDDTPRYLFLLFRREIHSKTQKRHSSWVASKFFKHKSKPNLLTWSRTPQKKEKKQKKASSEPSVRTQNWEEKRISSYISDCLSIFFLFIFLRRRGGPQKRKLKLKYTVSFSLLFSPTVNQTSKITFLLFQILCCVLRTLNASRKKIRNHQKAQRKPFSK